MCWLTSIYHAPCNHWGSRRVETPCASAVRSGLRSGCWNQRSENGTTRVQEFCPACLGRQRLANDYLGRTSQDANRQVEKKRESTYSGSRHRDGTSISSSVSKGTANDSTIIGGDSYSDNESNSSRTCSELGTSIEEEKKVEIESDGDFGRRFGDWVNFTATSSRSPWTGLGGSGGCQAFGTRFGGWVNYTTSTSTNPWNKGW